MKKSDLKSGMVVKFRYWNRLCMLIDNVFCEVDGSGFMELNNYDENMFNIKDGNQWDIIEVYKCKYPNIMSCFIENELELIWEHKEVDWSKVPFGTRVRVWDSFKDDKREARLLNYDKEWQYPFEVYDNDILIAFRYCELIEEPVTHEELADKYNRFCRSKEPVCEGCDYTELEDCTIAYMLDNYNVTRK